MSVAGMTVVAQGPTSTAIRQAPTWAWSIANTITARNATQIFLTAELTDMTNDLAVASESVSVEAGWVGLDWKGDQSR